MRAIKGTGSLLLVALALGLASTATASASLFRATKTGSLDGQAIESQVFKTSGGTIECEKVEVEGTVTELISTSQVLKEKYTECLLWGIIAIGMTLELLYDANEAVSIQKTAKIEAPGCEASIPAQGPLTSVSYENSGANLRIVNRVTGLESEGKGPSCEYSKENNGTYKGTLEVKLPSGEIEWTTE